MIPSSLTISSSRISVTVLKFLFGFFLSTVKWFLFFFNRESVSSAATIWPLLLPTRSWTAMSLTVEWTADGQRDISFCRFSVNRSCCCLIIISCQRRRLCSHQGPRSAVVQEESPQGQGLFASHIRFALSGTWCTHSCSTCNNSNSYSSCLILSLVSSTFKVTAVLEDAQRGSCSFTTYDVYQEKRLDVFCSDAEWLKALSQRIVDAAA